MGSLYPRQHTRCPLVALMTRSALFANITSAVSTSTVRLTSRKRRDVGVQVCVWHDVTFWNGFMLYFSSTLNHSVLFSWLHFCPLVSRSELITRVLFMLRMPSYCSNWLTAQRREWWFGDCGRDVRRWHMRDRLASAVLYSVWLGCDLISRTLESHDVHNYLAA